MLRMNYVVAVVSAFLSVAATLFSPIELIADERTVVTVERVVDGDTISVFIAGKKQKVRFIGVDAPESKSNDHVISQMKRFKIGMKRILSLGQLADSQLREQIKPGHRLTLEFDRQMRDPHGRILAYVYLANGESLNRWLVREGLAWAVTYKPNVKHQYDFENAEKEARKRGMGIWH